MILPRPQALFAVAAVTWKEWAAFRSHMAVSLFVGPLRFLILVWIWTATTTAGKTVGGMALADLVAYSGLAILLGYASFDFADWNLQMLVRTGVYVNHLLQPMHHAWYALAQKFGHRLLALLIEAVPVWILVSLYLEKPLLPRNPGWFLLSAGVGFLLMFVVNYASGLVGFWLVRAEGVRRCVVLVRDLLGGAVLPLSFFPMAVQPFLFLTPYPWVLYVPLRIATGNVELAGRILSPAAAVGGQVAVLALAAMGTMAFDALSRRRFLAAGG
ncbi:MAG: ABC-2 family transporter protein [Fibrobacterota bacterium]|nr:ABC-2 family transporter protein [Fibrobacterota bacterium]QQS06076.1 MAG: ABC-2 family transporter protein [Fibrobacterota bacterium]